MARLPPVSTVLSSAKGSVLLRVCVSPMIIAQERRTSQRALIRAFDGLMFGRELHRVCLRRSSCSVCGT